MGKLMFSKWITKYNLMYHIYEEHELIISSDNILLFC